MCGGGVTSGEHDVASRAGRREEGNWRAIGVANHVGGDSMISWCSVETGKEKLVPGY